MVKILVLLVEVIIVVACAGEIVVDLLFPVDVTGLVLHSGLLVLILTIMVSSLERWGGES